MVAIGHRAGVSSGGSDRLPRRRSKGKLATAKTVVVSTAEEISDDRIGLVAGGVAFYAMLALAPTMIAAVSLYGLFTTPEALESQIEALSRLLPPEAASLVVDQLRAITESSSTGLSVGAIVGIVVALYTATKGTDAIIGSLGIACDTPETRGFFALKLRSLVMTLALIVVGILMVSLIAVVPVAFSFVGLDSFGRMVAEVIRWPVLFLLAMVGVSALYHFGPAQHEGRFRWVSLGAFVATLVWVLASLGFSFYVSNFGNYDATYGSLGGVVVLLLWLWLSAYAILLGAEINAALGRQRHGN